MLTGYRGNQDHISLNGSSPSTAQLEPPIKAREQVNPFTCKMGTFTEARESTGPYSPHHMGSSNSRDGNLSVTSSIPSSSSTQTSNNSHCGCQDPGGLTMENTLEGMGSTPLLLKSMPNPLQKMNSHLRGRVM